MEWPLSACQLQAGQCLSANKPGGEMLPIPVNGIYLKPCFWWGFRFHVYSRVVLCFQLFLFSKKCTSTGFSLWVTSFFEVLKVVESGFWGFCSCKGRVRVSQCTDLHLLDSIAQWMHEVIGLTHSWLASPVSHQKCCSFFPPAKNSNLYASPSNSHLPSLRLLKHLEISKK